MDADELRNLADALEPMAPAPRFSGIDAPAACAYLRACADAMDAGPVAWRCEVRGTGSHGMPATEWRHYGTYATQSYADKTALRCGDGIEVRTVQLYPLAMPAQAQPLRLPEPLTEDELLDTYAHTPGSIACALRAIEAETLRRAREANNAVAMLDAAPTPPAQQDACLKCGDAIHPNYGCGDASALRSVAQQDDEALAALRELVEARDAFNAATKALQLQKTLLRLRRATVEARALLTKRGAA